MLEHAYLEIKREQVYPPKKMLEDLYNLGYQRVKYVDRPLHLLIAEALLMFIH